MSVQAINIRLAGVERQREEKKNKTIVSFPRLHGSTAAISPPAAVCLLWKLVLKPRSCSYHTWQFVLCLYAALQWVPFSMTARRLLSRYFRRGLLRGGSAEGTSLGPCSVASATIGQTWYPIKSFSTLSYFFFRFVHFWFESCVTRVDGSQLLANKFARSISFYPQICAQYLAPTHTSPRAPHTYLFIFLLQSC